MRGYSPMLYPLIVLFFLYHKATSFSDLICGWKGNILRNRKFYKNKTYISNEACLYTFVNKNEFIIFAWLAKRDTMKYKDYIPPLSDFGFKNLFGTEKNKENLIVLLNAILHERLGFEKIVDVRLNPTEQKGENPDRKSIQYDIHCQTDKGHRIIVEMQNQWHPNFENRMFYYGIEAISRQDRRIQDHAVWDFTIDPVISLALCNFRIKRMGERPISFFTFREEETNLLFGRQMNLVFLQLPLFTDKMENCNTEIEKIIFSLRNMERIQNMGEVPFSIEEGDFYSRIAQSSRYSALSEEERLEYDRFMKFENDRLLEKQWSREEGLAEGRAEGRAEGVREEKQSLAKKMLQMGLERKLISEITGLSEEELGRME